MTGENPNIRERYEALLIYFSCRCRPRWALALTLSSSSPCHRSSLGTSRGLVLMGGEYMAIPHKTVKTGYKAPNAYGAKAVFSGET